MAKIDNSAVSSHKRLNWMSSQRLSLGWLKYQINCTHLYVGTNWVDEPVSSVDKITDLGCK